MHAPRRPNNPHGSAGGAAAGSGVVHLLPQSDSAKARLFLAVACLWPLMIMALFASSAPHAYTTTTGGLNGTTITTIAASNGGSSTLRNLLDRVDILGYGPTHPRLSVVITGDANLDNLRTSVESIFQYTDLNRIFLVTVVVDGHDYDPNIVKELVKIDSGAIPHWHGLRPDLNNNKGDKPGAASAAAKEAEGEKAAGEDDPHGRKVHVIFNPERIGTAASRADGAALIDLLQKKHEAAGLKSKDEDILLLLMRSGATLTSRKWLSLVTDALIVPPPIFSSQERTLSENNQVAMKLANAVAFNLEGPGKRTSFDSTFTPVISQPTVDEINLSNGVSYPTPALNGAATAMRLDTFLSLPSQDTMETLTHADWPADLELSLNLWLCADGIDMLQDVTITSFENAPSAPLPPELAARFAAAWMDPVSNKKFFNAYQQVYEEVTFLEWETLQARARHSPTFTPDLPQKCRSFAWFAKEINSQHLSDFLEQTEKLMEGEEFDDDQIDDEHKSGDNENEDADKDNEEGVKHDDAEQDNIKNNGDDRDGNAPPGDAGDGGVEEQQNEDKNSGESGDKDNSEEKGDSNSEEKGDSNSEEKGDSNSEEKGDSEENGDSGNSKEDGDNKHRDAKEEPNEEEIHNSIPQRNDKKMPSKPLCKECLEIVQQAEPIDITYVDMTGGHKDHPHLGATYPNGTELGYIHDETSLRRNPPKPLTGYPDEILRKGCSNRDYNYRMLHEKVFVDLEADEAKNKAGEKRDTIFCLVYTIDKGHPNVQRIRETWGPKCDGFMVGSNKTDPAFDAVNIVHEGPEEYGNIWQKVRSMWSYIYDNYYEKYDWFHIGGDDMFMVMENLRLYLESEEIKTAANGGLYLPDGTEKIQTPLFMGRRFAYLGDMNEIFNSGGSGYTFNKAALKTLVVKGFPNYLPHMKTFSEDTMVAKTLKHFGILPYETKDEKGGERYMPFLPAHHYTYHIPKDKSKDWYAKYSINIKEGVDHCAARSVAFHYVKDNMMYRLFSMLYHMCPADTLEE